MQYAVSCFLLCRLIKKVTALLDVHQTDNEVTFFTAQYFFDFLIAYCVLVAGFALLSLGGSAVCRRR